LTPRQSATAEHSASRPAVIAAFAAIYLCWGGTFLALRYAVSEVPPLLTITIRCLGGALLIYGWLLWQGTVGPANRKQWVTSAIAGAFLFVGGHGVLAWSEQRVSSGQAALCMTSIPLWLVLLNSLRERRAPTRLVMAGLVLGVLGVALLVRGNGDWSGPMLQRLSLLGSGLCWAIGSLIARHGSRPNSATQSTAMQLAAGGVAVLALSALTGELGHWSPIDLTLRGGLSVMFLVIAGTVIGFGAYTWLLQVTTPAAVGTYAFVNPVVAVTLALIVGDEVFSIRTVVAGLLVLGAVLLIWRSSIDEGKRFTQSCHPETSEGVEMPGSKVVKQPQVVPTPSLRSG
jgi:drug/metabolite transporter (DMT)-like permease